MIQSDIFHLKYDLSILKIIFATLLPLFYHSSTTLLSLFYHSSTTLPPLFHTFLKKNEEQILKYFKNISKMGNQNSSIIFPKDVYLMIFKIAIEEDNSTAVAISKVCKRTYSDKYISYMANKEMKKRCENFIWKCNNLWFYNFEYTLNEVKFYVPSGLQFLEYYNGEYIFTCKGYDSHGYKSLSWKIRKARWKRYKIKIFLGEKIKEIKK